MIAAALWATFALRGADALEQRVLGRRPAYDVNAMGRRLFGSARAGRALRWIYGPTLAIVQKKLRIPAWIMGPTIALAELVAMPAVGATPPVRKWPRGEVPMLFAHATTFALLVDTF
jgi:hypothetical protein